MSEGPDEEGGAVGGVEDDEESKRMPRYERSLGNFGEYVEDLEEDFDEEDETGLPKPYPTGTKMWPPRIREPRDNCLAIWYPVRRLALLRSCQFLESDYVARQGIQPVVILYNWYLAYLTTSCSVDVNLLT